MEEKKKGGRRRRGKSREEGREVEGSDEERLEWAKVTKGTRQRRDEENEMGWTHNGRVS
jgi:hypothetical protein